MSTIIIGIILLIILCVFLRKIKNKDYIYLFFLSIFYIYLLFVLKYTIFPVPLNSHMLEIMRKNSAFLSGINVIPFKISSIKYFISIQVIENIILSTPFGFGISYITKLTKKKMILLGILFGVIIEAIQLIISLFLRYTYRVIDVNDVIFNFIGVFFGYSLFKIFALLFVKFVEKYNISLNTFLNYIYKVSKNDLLMRHSS